VGTLHRCAHTVGRGGSFVGRYHDEAHQQAGGLRRRVRGRPRLELVEAGVDRPPLSASTLLCDPSTPPGKGAHRWMNRWKPALNAFAIAIEGRLFPTDQ
jgi:hypothetical protein